MGNQEGRWQRRTEIRSMAQDSEDLEVELWSGKTTRGSPEREEAH